MRGRDFWGGGGGMRREGGAWRMGRGGSEGGFFWGGWCVGGFLF